MSNIYTIVDARLVSPPKEIELGGRKLTKLRVADNPISRERNKTRYVDCLLGGRDQAAGLRLSEADVITITGELTQREYTDKNGVVRTSDEMSFVNAFKVQKSSSFFGKNNDTEPDLGPAGPAPAGDDLPF